MDLRAAKKRTDLDVELLDLRDYPLPFFEEAMPPGMAKDQYSNPVVVKWRDKIREADGFIICTPEYNHGYPAVLKNALDYTYFAWARKAVSFVSWGGAGGARGVEQLRLVAVELDMVPTRWAVHIPNPWFIKDVSEIDTEANRNSAAALLDHLTWWAGALKAARNRSASLNCIMAGPKETGPAHPPRSEESSRLLRRAPSSAPS